MSKLLQAPWLGVTLPVTLRGLLDTRTRGLTSLTLQAFESPSQALINVFTEIMYYDPRILNTREKEKSLCTAA